MLFRAEIISLAYILRLEDNQVKKVLDKLVEHGILNVMTRSRADFEKNIAKTMLVDVESVHYKTHVTKLQVYSFKIDLMFILKARIFLLRKSFND